MVNNFWYWKQMVGASVVSFLIFYAIGFFLNVQEYAVIVSLTYTLLATLPIVVLYYSEDQFSRNIAATTLSLFVLSYILSAAFVLPDLYESYLATFKTPTATTLVLAYMTPITFISSIFSAPLIFTSANI